MVTDVVNETKLRLVHYDIQSPDEVRESNDKICAYSDANALIVYDIKKFLSEKLYNHPKLITMSEWAEEIIQYLFQYFTDQSDKLPDRFQEMLLTEDKEIVIADYIAGMTDRYAINLYDSLQ